MKPMWRKTYLFSCKHLLDDTTCVYIVQLYGQQCIYYIKLYLCLFAPSYDGSCVHADVPWQNNELHKTHTQMKQLLIVRLLVLCVLVLNWPCPLYTNLIVCVIRMWDCCCSSWGSVCHSQPNFPTVLPWQLCHKYSSGSCCEGDAQYFSSESKCMKNTERS